MSTCLFCEKKLLNRQKYYCSNSCLKLHIRVNRLTNVITTLEEPISNRNITQYFTNWDLIIFGRLFPEIYINYKTYNGIRNLLYNNKELLREYNSKRIVYDLLNN